MAVRVGHPKGRAPVKSRKGKIGAPIKRPMPAPTSGVPRVTAAGIRFLRDRLEMSMPQLAAALGLSPKSGRTSVFRWEHGLALPSDEARERIAALAEARGVAL